MIRVIFAALVLLPSLVNAKQDIQSLNARVKQKTEVMVLGTMHLKSIKEEIDLSEIRGYLGKFKPTAIAVESLRGEDIFTMLNGSVEYHETLTSFVGDELLGIAKKEQSSLGLSATEAIQKMKQFEIVNNLSDEKRIELIRLSIAGYYPDTATLHWLKLTENDTSQLSSDLKAYLNARATKNNETLNIAINLALSEGINTIYPIDDHLDKDMYQDMVKRLMPSYSKSQAGNELQKSTFITKSQALQKHAIQTGDWLPLYLWLNSPEQSSQVIGQEWSMFVDKDLDVEPALARVALWEVRNLNMVSHIMRVVANEVGGRIVIIVGASHRVFFEEYLSKMIGVEVIPFSDYVTEYVGSE
ncbi:MULTISPECIES: DUF5694 domain-containing protein [unclassified Shewanella]|uniref:DUF5694 domain-containing protein n=1 Tax=unclassified Shewanella TaxID=196818 RepID=UPI003552B12F